MVFRACRINIALLIEREIGIERKIRAALPAAVSAALPAALSAALLLGAPLAHAQSLAGEDELKNLIPDAAVINPDEWAKAKPSSEQSAGTDAVPKLDPSTALVDLPGLMLPWPDEDFQVPQLAPLEPDPDIGLALQQQLPADGTPPESDITQLSPRLALVFPADIAALPERVEVESRFRALSTLENLARGGNDNIAQVAVRARSDKLLLERLMRIYGYYDAQVMQTVGGIGIGQERAAGETPAGDVKVRFDISPGPRFRFGTIALGELLATGPDYPLLRDAFGIKPGDPLYSDAIVAEARDLDFALGENGYAFAKQGEPELLVDHAREEGDLTMPLTPGGKYRIGEVISDDPRFLPGRHLESIARFDRGDVYKRSEVDDLRRAILATGLVSSVTVKARETAPPTAGEAGMVALDVAIARAPLRTIAAGAGYDSGDGLRVEASWEHRNFFPPEGMVRVRAVAGTKEQLAGVTFRRNNFRARDQVLTFDLYASNVNRDAYAARTIALSGNFEKLSTLIFQKPFTWGAGFEALLSDEREATVVGAPTVRRTYKIGALPLRAAFDGSDNLLDPKRGLRAAIRVSPEVSVQAGKSSTYARLQADASYYLPVGDSIVLAARARLGMIPGTALANIAPSRRFYAGGGGSVRGFGYQQIGPRDVLGEPSGGRSLSEFSLEARIQTGLLGGALAVVPFIDAGAVDETVTPRLKDMRLGAGLGLRYQTGFGPIRVDIGTPLDRQPGESRIGVYVALGQAF